MILCCHRCSGSSTCQALDWLIKSAGTLISTHHLPAMVQCTSACISRAMQGLANLLQAKTLSSFNELLQELKAVNKNKLTILLLGEPTNVQSTPGFLFFIAAAVWPGLLAPVASSASELRQCYETQLCILADDSKACMNMPHNIYFRTWMPLAQCSSADARRLHGLHQHTL